VIPFYLTLQKSSIPFFWDFPAPELKGYTPQTSIAEKFESIIRLGFANTRLKDFYDVWLLIQQFDFDRKELQKIILQVLKNRGTKRLLQLHFWKLFMIIR
jgi:hypothetical protein